MEIPFLKSINPFHKARNLRALGEVHPSETFHGLIDRERARADRTGQEFSIACFDAGDLNGRSVETLSSLAAILTERVRETDVVGWLREECLGVFLSGTGSKGAWIFTEDVRGKAKLDSVPVKCLVYTYPSVWISPNGNGNGTRGSKQDTDDMGREESPPVEDLKPLVARRIPTWKRMIDILGAVAGLILLSPLFLLISILIKIVSPGGPVFYRQERIGHAGRTFTFFKFRTMHPDNDAMIHQRYLSTLIRGDQAMEKLDADRDPRIIRFGKFLRQSCLDELPQLINVLRGEMSLVGPRPCLPYEAQEYLQWHARRFDNVPGMTGLWQVNGKNKTTFKQMIRFDIAYSQQISPWMDLRILLKTIPVILNLVMDHLSGKRGSSASQPRSMVKRPS